MLPPVNPYGHIDLDRDLMTPADCARDIGYHLSGFPAYCERYGVDIVRVAGRPMIWRTAWREHVEKMKGIQKLDQNGKWIGKREQQEAI